MCPISALPSRRPEPGGGEGGWRLALYAVRVERGGPWDWSLDMREQGDWDAHARFMDGLVDDGIILLGGPLEGDREVLHASKRRPRRRSRASRRIRGRSGAS